MMHAALGQTNLNLPCERMQGKFSTYKAPEKLRDVWTHNLQVELGRWHDRRPRCQRVCDRCDMHASDDEWHLVFECPAFEHLRSVRQHLFAGFDVPDMTAFMRQCDQTGVMCHILACIQEIKASADVDCSFDVDLNLCEEPDSDDD